MKPILLFFLISLSFSSSYGQSSSFTIGLQAGPSLMFLTGNEAVQDGSRRGLGFSGGFSFGYYLSERFSFLVNPSFERKGSEYRDDIIVVDSNAVELGPDKFVLKTHLDYLTLPVLFRASTGEKLNYFVNAGPYVGYLINATEILKKSTYLDGYRIDQMDWFKRFDFGFSLGIGMTAPIHEHFRLGVELRNHTGIVNTSSVELVNSGALRTNSTYLLVSLNY